MSSALKLGEYPGDDAPAWQLNEYALAAHMIAEGLLEEDDTRTAQILGVQVEDLAGGVASTATAEVVHAAVTPEINPVNCLAAIMEARHSALQTAALDGLPAAETRQLVAETVAKVEGALDRHAIEANLAALTFAGFPELHHEAA